MDSGIVFGRPWLKSQADILSGLDAGRVATALMGSEKIIFVTEGFLELPALIELLTWEELSRLCNDGKFSFLCHPELMSVGGNGSGNDEVVTLLMEQDFKLRNGPEALKKSIFNSVNESIISNLTISEEQAAIVASVTTVTPTSFQGKVKNLFAKDLLDITKRKELDEFFKNYFEIDYSPLDLIKIEFIGSNMGITIPLSRKGQFPKGAEQKATTSILMINEAYKQYLFAVNQNATAIYSDDSIYELMKIASHSNKMKGSGVIQGSVDSMFEAIELPDIGWMVNRLVLTMKEVLGFHYSQEGTKFRLFLKEFSQKLGTNTDKLKEEMKNTIINSFHNKTWWEEKWSSKGAKLTRFGIAAGITFIPVAQLAGAALAISESAADFMLDEFVIPKGYRPTLILMEKIKKHVDEMRLKEEMGRKHVFPSLDKLIKQGYEATMVFEFPNNLRTIILNVPGKEIQWSLGIDLSISECREYLKHFESLLPVPGSKQRELVDALGKGYEYLNLQTKFNNVDGDGELIQVFTLRNGEVELKIEGNTKDCWDFVMDRSFLKDPAVYLKFKNKIEKI